MERGVSKNKSYNSSEMSICLNYIFIFQFFFFFRLTLDINITRWATGAGEKHIPRSLCSDNCPLGHVRNFQVNKRIQF